MICIRVRQTYTHIYIFFSPYLKMKMKSMSSMQKVATLSMVFIRTTSCLLNAGMNLTSFSTLSSLKVLSTDKPPSDWPTISHTLRRWTQTTSTIHKRSIDLRHLHKVNSYTVHACLTETPLGFTSCSTEVREPIFDIQNVRCHNSLYCQTRLYIGTLILYWPVLWTLIMYWL